MTSKYAVEVLSTEDSWWSSTADFEIVQKGITFNGELEAQGYGAGKFGMNFLFDDGINAGLFADWTRMEYYPMVTTSMSYIPDTNEVKEHMSYLANDILEDNTELLSRSQGVLNSIWEQFGELVDDEIFSGLDDKDTNSDEKQDLLFKLLLADHGYISFR